MRRLPVLARQLPLPIPIPVARGTPGSAYPWSVTAGLTASRPRAREAIDAHGDEVPRDDIDQTLADYAQGH